MKRATVPASDRLAASTAAWPSATVETTSKSDASRLPILPRLVVIVRYDDARPGHVAAISIRVDACHPRIGYNGRGRASIECGSRSEGRRCL